MPPQRRAPQPWLRGSSVGRGRERPACGRLPPAGDRAEGRGTRLIPIGRPWRRGGSPPPSPSADFLSCTSDRPCRRRQRLAAADEPARLLPRPTRVPLPSGGPASGGHHDPHRPRSSRRHQGHPLVPRRSARQSGHDRASRGVAPRPWDDTCDALRGGVPPPFRGLAGPDGPSCRVAHRDEPQKAMSGLRQ